jgi:hypothetical protein
MANLTTVDLTAGVPTAGTGTVMTINSLAADGGMVTIGAKADAKSTATDTTAVTAMSVWKQISASVQALNTAIGSTLWDLGLGTGGSRTQRVIVDSGQLSSPGQTTMSLSTPVAIASDQSNLPIKNGASQYETVAASQTNQVMGATGAAGDYLSHVIVSPGTAGCGVVTVLDNATAIASFPGGGTTALNNLIPFIIPIGIVSTSGAWKITTGANVTAVGVGKFT